MVCFSCGKSGHTATHCPTLDKEFLFLQPGWRTEKTSDGFAMIPPWVTTDCRWTENGGFNGLPVYYGGDLCDSKELEEYGTLDLAHASYDNFDAPERMDLMTCSSYTHSRRDGGET